MCVASDPFLGVCPGEMRQVGGVNAQTSDLKFLSLQSNWLLLADKHRGRGACRETGGCANKHTRVMWPGKQAGGQWRHREQVDRSYHGRPRGLTVSIWTVRHPSSLNRRSAPWMSAAGPGSVLLSLGQRWRSYQWASPGLGHPPVEGWGWRR